MHDIGIADEDSVALDDRRDGVKRLIDVAVVHLPHISNFDDFDALDRDPAVSLRYVDATAKLGRPDLIVLR
jgi:adenosylcobyric acid synthase